MAPNAVINFTLKESRFLLTTTINRVDAKELTQIL